MLALRQRIQRQDMIALEFKVRAKQNQYNAIDEAIKTANFVRNKCLHYWMDGQKVSIGQKRLSPF